MFLEEVHWTKKLEVPLGDDPSAFRAVLLGRGLSLDRPGSICATYTFWLSRGVLLMLPIAQPRACFFFYQSTRQRIVKGIGGPCMPCLMLLS